MYTGFILFIMLLHPLASRPLFGLSDPCMPSARASRSPTTKKQAIRGTQTLRPVVIVDIDIIINSAGHTGRRTDKFNGRDVIKNKESGTQIRCKTQELSKEFGILGFAVNRLIFAEIPGSCGENRNIRGIPPLSIGETLGPLVQLIELA